jgi:nicotinamidase-related amidase
VRPLNASSTARSPGCVIGDDGPARVTAEGDALSSRERLRVSPSQQGRISGHLRRTTRWTARANIPPSAPKSFCKHKPLGVGEIVAAPDGRDSRTLVKGTWGTEILPELAPEETDIVVPKHRYSGFFETRLDAILRERGIDSLVFTGCTTSVCVDSTLRDAFYRDYRCLLLSDCTGEPIGSDLVRSNHEASLLVIETLFGWVADSRSLLGALQQDDAALTTAAHRSSPRSRSPRSQLKEAHRLDRS